MSAVFGSSRRQLARIRCLKQSVKCLKDSEPLPEALCYVPGCLEYKYPNASDSNGRVTVYSKTDRKSKCGEIVFSRETTIFASGEESCNSDGLWIRLTNKSFREHIKGKENVKEGWILLYELKAGAEMANVLLPVVPENSTAAEQRVKGKQVHPLCSWEQILEYTYSLKVGTPPVIVEADSAAVERLCRAPQNWTIENDEELAKFLAEHMETHNEKLGSVKQFVESVDVSSTCEEDDASCLTDGDTSTYWESDGSQGQHWMRLHMKKGTIIKRLYIAVDGQDDNYMPSHVIVMAGQDGSNLKKINDCNIDVNYTGDYCILEDMTQHYKVIEVRIKECKDGGIDTRIHGIKIKSTKEKDLGLNKDLFKNSELVRYPRLESVDKDVLYRRAITMQRFIKLFDSVIQYIIPSWQYSIGSFGELNAVRQILVLSKKRSSLIQRLLKQSETSKPSSMPKLYINRRAASEHKSDPSKDPECKSTVFSQIYEGLKSGTRSNTQLDFRWPQRYDQWWECKFLSEGIIDQGGGFRDSLSDISEELCPTANDQPDPLPFFVRSPNQKHEDLNTNRDVFVPNPGCKEFIKYEWIGMLMGGCLRSKENLVLALPSFVWKQLAGECISWSRDFTTVDSAAVKLLELLESIDQETFDESFADDLTFTTMLSNQTVAMLKEDGDKIKVQYEQRMEFCRLVQEKRMNESKQQIAAIKHGILQVIPQAVLDLMTWQQLETSICGNPEISLEALKKTTFYEDIEQNDTRVKYLWEAMANFTNEDRSRFLRFVTGRRRLPAPLYIAADRGTEKTDSLPESSTCSNTLFLPCYSSAKVAEEKLRYAAYNCVAIDTDMGSLVE
ncbi:E3 ubiquitin-protein ligase HECTD3-like [Anneissia japonica]|uniref:E3 ubiquitin-protein ligase HECTD3-like n=1 Tax=Anneissia japonica TaxID=1529436 RepID=UPI0014254DF7|nr:E3 ubiquitin-protein ligase HECTD3-like [Anneissia japonica]